MHVALNHSSVHPKLLSWRDALFAGDANDPPQHLLGKVATKQGKGAAEDGMVGGGIGVVVGEAAIEEIAA